MEAILSVMFERFRLIAVLVVCILLSAHQLRLYVAMIVRQVLLVLLCVQALVCEAVKSWCTCHSGLPVCMVVLL